MLNNLKGKFGLAGMMIALFVMLLGDSAQKHIFSWSMRKIPMLLEN